MTKTSHFKDPCQAWKDTQKAIELINRQMVWILTMGLTVQPEQLQGWCEILAGIYEDMYHKPLNGEDTIPPTGA